MLEQLNLDPMTALLIVGAVTGFVEFIKALFDKNWRAAVIVGGSAVVGGLLSLVLPIDLIVGIVAGMAATGYVTLAQNVGKNL